MKDDDYLNAQLALHKVQKFGAVAIRFLACGLFIAMVGLFATAPTGEAVSVFDAPLPLPPELGLE